MGRCGSVGRGLWATMKHRARPCTPAILDGLQGSHGAHPSHGQCHSHSYYLNPATATPHLKPTTPGRRSYQVLHPAYIQAHSCPLRP